MLKKHLKNNNLDVLRLVFAVQVMLVHLGQEFNSDLIAKITSIVKYFPGVPAFFFLSGFLIYASYSQNRNLNQYISNRFYRLYPGLIFATFGGLVLAIFGHQILFGDLPDTYLSIKWVFAQLTLGQGWNPDEFRMIGNGVINGVLWTITVELMFYCVVPLIVWVETRIKYFVWYASVLSFAVYSTEVSFINIPSLGSTPLFDYLKLTPIVWGWMFGLGILSYKYFSYLSVILKHGHWLILLMLGLICLDIDSDILFKTVGNRLGIIYFLIYSAVILYIGFHNKVLHIKNDLSYSIYIWHMLVINFLIVIDVTSITLALFLTIGIAYFSWMCIEKPCLKLKSWSIRSGL